MSIVLERLTKRYGDATVVEDVSLEIEKGELFVLLGPSGSGKSTLLRMIAGLTEIDSGRVFLHGQDVTGVPPKDRGIGFVFQHYALFRHMSVAENVEFSLRVRRRPAAERRQRCEELIAMVGLAGYGGRLPRQLSGGQQQRVALARALAPHPPVLLLDEPFGALDAKIRVELRQTLRRLQRELGVTAIFVTHDQEEAFELADRVAVLHLGRLLEVGPPTELYLRPRTPFVATFLGAGNLLVGESGPRSVRLGPVELPLGTEATSPDLPRRVQVLFRPEDAELTPDPGAVGSTLLGRGVVEDQVFAGSGERLRLRLEALPGARPIAPLPPFGSDFFWVDATRPQHEVVRFPLRRGDEAWVGIRRVHVLWPARFHFLAVRDGSAPARAAAELAEALRARVGARLTLVDAPGPGNVVLPEPEAAAVAEPASFDVVVLGVGDDGLDLEAGARLAAGPRHLLLVSGPAPVPTRILVCVKVGEPGKVDVQLAERLAWQLGAATTLLTVRPESERRRPLPHIEQFLAAGARALAARHVEARIRVRYGAPRREILAELAEGGHDLLVVGAPLPVDDTPRLAGLVAQLASEPPGCPVLVVRTREGR